MADIVQFLVIFLCGLLIVPTQGAINKYGCGIYAGRIVGGNSSESCQFPWVVTIVNNATNFTTCNGAILDEIHVVTAASCLFKKVKAKFVLVHHSQLSVYYGSSLSSPRSEIHVLNIDVHERFKTSTLENNIAILTLNGVLVFTNCLRPVCVSNGKKNPRKSKQCLVMGWGITSADGTKNAPTMNWMKVSLPKQKDCPILQLSLTLTLTTNKALCKGDSGAPLVCQERDRQYYLYGLATILIDTNCNSKSDLYTDVGKYYMWINNITEWFF